LTQSGHCSAPNTTDPVGPAAVLPLPPPFGELLLLDPHAASTSANAAVTTVTRTKPLRLNFTKTSPCPPSWWIVLVRTDVYDPRDEVNVRPTASFVLLFGCYKPAIGT
jgi:hypothetical protein